MNILNKLKKGQGLPLNTIVIAILVIIVLLIIVVFFATSMSDQGEVLDANSATKCSIDNMALTTMGYTSVESKDYEKTEENKGCDDLTRISVVPVWKEGTQEKVCCGTKD